MRLTTKGRYAVTAMLDLAIHHGARARSRWPISPSGRVFRFPTWSSCSRACANATWFPACAAPAADTRLGREAANIFVAQVISAVDENVDTTRCGGAHNCQDNQQCLTHDLWQDLSARIFDYLNQISLQDLMNRVACRKSRSDRGAEMPTSVSLGQLKAETAGA